MVLRNSDTGKVINEVRVRECLWNPRDVDYLDKLARQQAWKEVSMAVVPKYNKRSSEVQREIVKTVQSRWKTARDAFMKCYEANGKKYTYRGKSTYVHYNKLTFLEQVIDYENYKLTSLEQVIDYENNANASRVTQDINDEEDASILSIDDDETDDIDFNMDIHEDGNEDLVRNDPEGSTKVINDTFVFDSLPGTSKIGNQQDPLSTAKTKVQRKKCSNPRSRKRKCSMSEFETRLLKIMSDKNSQSSSALQKDDQCFFNSLGPLINDFSNYQKLHFRLKILELIRELKIEPTVSVKQEEICVEDSDGTKYIFKDKII